MTDVPTHIDTAGYAVDALDELERVRADRHLADCPSCRAEVLELRELTAVLAGGVPPMQPSPAIRTNLLAQVAQTPQEHVAPAGRSVGRHRRSSSPHRRRQTVFGLVAAAAVVVAGAGVLQSHPWSADHPGVVSAEARITKAPDAQRQSAPFNGGTVTVISSRSLNQAVARLDKVHGVRSGSTYQGWYIKSDGPTNAGLLKTQHTNALASNLTGAREFDITVEPTGGSSVPTKTPVLAIRMT